MDLINNDISKYKQIIPFNQFNEEKTGERNRDWGNWSMFFGLAKAAF